MTKKFFDQKAPKMLFMEYVEIGGPQKAIFQNFLSRPDYKGVGKKFDSLIEIDANGQGFR